MFPSPAIRRWSSSTAFTGAVRPASSLRRNAAVNASSSGSGPSFPTTSAGSSTMSQVPNLRRSLQRRSCPPLRVMRPRSYSIAGSPAARHTSRPVIRRCVTKVRPSSMPNRRYFPRRPSQTNRRPTSPARSPSMGRSVSSSIVPGSTSTAATVRPTTSGSRSRLIVSTSGSSGTALSLPALRPGVAAA